MRGSVARIQINNVASNIVLKINPKLEAAIKNGTVVPVKNTTVKSLIIKIFAYSAIKNNANIPLLYSTLKPDTSSDSPSTRSNGVRLVSAKFVINHIIASGLTISMIHDIEFIKIDVMFILEHNTSALIRIKDILTSYEIVWATPRMAPNNAYFELDLHPAINVE